MWQQGGMFYLKLSMYIENASLLGGVLTTPDYQKCFQTFSDRGLPYYRSLDGPQHWTSGVKKKEKKRGKISLNNK